MPARSLLIIPSHIIYITQVTLILIIRVRIAYPRVALWTPLPLGLELLRGRHLHRVRLRRLAFPRDVIPLAEARSS